MVTCVITAGTPLSRGYNDTYHRMPKLEKKVGSSTRANGRYAMRLFVKFSREASPGVYAGLAAYGPIRGSKT